MNVLVINCGSSSLKFQLQHVPPDAERSTEGRTLATGRVQALGADARLTFQPAGGAAEHVAVSVADHATAVRLLLDRLAAHAATLGSIEAVGHRFVHGGARFQKPARIDDDVLAHLEALRALAPLHNGPALAGLGAVQAALDEALPHVAVFDTAFHAHLPQVAQTYGLPWALAERHGIRRYGFHGTSCRSVVERYGELTGALPDARLIVLHLGAGCSATAVQGGRSMDTSMGFTPLEGLLMATRSGDVDPALPAFLAEREGLSPAAVERLLNEESGLMGVSGRSGDLRELLAHEADDPRARLAVALYCYRVRKAVGANLAALGGADAILFTGGVGEHLPEIRARIGGPLAWCGLRMDEARNAAADGGPTRISDATAALHAWVMPSDEERMIAWDTARCLTGVS